MEKKKRARVKPKSARRNFCHFTNRQTGVGRFSQILRFLAKKATARKIPFRDFSNLVSSVSAAHAQSRVSRNPGIDVETRAMSETAERLFSHSRHNRHSF